MNAKTAGHDLKFYEERFRPKQAREPIRIMLVDDYGVERAGLKMLIESWSGLEVTAEAADPETAMTMIPVVKPDLVLIDADRSLVNDNIGVLRDLVAVDGETRFVLLTGLHDEKTLRQAILAGVKGVVFKDKAASELHRAVERVHSGELWINHSLTASIVAEMTRTSERKKVDSEQTMLESLTKREREIAAIVCEGLRNQGIGERLLISETTVRHHLSSIFSKLNLTTRFELIVFLCRNRFVNLSDRTPGNLVIWIILGLGGSLLESAWNVF